MNDTIYYDVLCEYIQPEDRIICSRRDRHLIAIKSQIRHTLLASIYVHLGSPCNRFCICKFFQLDDFLIAYDRRNITDNTTII